MNIRYALKDDIFILSLYDKHIRKSELELSIKLKRVLLAEDNGKFIGFLRYNLFWDNTPFMNMLYILEDNRNKGYGKALVNHWENEMQALGYSTVMTSTQSNEYSQHFYIKSGYQTIGGFLSEHEPYELILSKSIK